MREIKFRGNAIDGSGFVEGSLLIGFTGIHYIITMHDHILGMTTMYEVDEKTVGQFTGLQFNGVDLYEGDIIEWYQRPDGYPQDPSKVRKTKAIAIKNLISGCFLFNFHDYKIIGNIHQNPELL